MLLVISHYLNSLSTEGIPVKHPTVHPLTPPTLATVNPRVEATGEEHFPNNLARRTL